MSSRTDDAGAKGARRLRLLFVDDEAPIRMVMGKELQRIGHDVTVVDGGKAALAALSENAFDAAIVDLRMPEIDGWAVIEHIKKSGVETDVIISTGHGGMDDAIRAIRLGAYDFLRKPYKIVEIDSVLNRVAEKRTLANRALALESELQTVRGKTDLIGESPAMGRVKKLVERIAPTDSSVLILGDTGTGKELVARSVHEYSQRSKMPFVAVNCGALPENLVESELFGHKKGAFTGADTPRKGLIEVANGGTLFLDELGELDKGMQVKLLRFLESGEVRRVGENDAFTVDVRVVCATNRNLEDMVAEGTFREDLFFRVNTFEIRLPALRERKDDIPALARFLAARHLKRKSVPDEILSPETIEVLRAHEWSGNVRELANAIEHAVILSDGKTIQPEDLPTSVSRRPAAGNKPFEISNFSFPMTLREIEMEVILQTMDKFRGDKPKTADELGIALKTLYNKLNQHQSLDQAKAG
ncbi:sigma-54-dependent transcriptional regulator [Planctomicrobium piriforme]|uniref:DNA-binding transcriptional response regulator, NtrC family, contains REC, AAA-type ATPase, and a Fis-type DNA-binding domains n=1 Tax=Planctomicrobium piriforme TaxID=1576369 RepID=A0A1I3HXD0_9PLAN|nr:sigma-54 dependent transcriptional regulator [Planctomicrobium piriforme]SFI40273.1 DNA-binding transcriptional response regulator, NtrC family, contains REC, AAA-type ATPase, and a Fis-type DNA-binding domains [Planctomicrobium piriforme]